MRGSRIWFVIVFAVGLTAQLAAQQDLLARVRDLYVAARYEEALAAIEEAPSVSPAIEQPLAEYQALCLVALSRINEAERRVEHILTLNPLYRPGDVPPHFVALVARVRNEFLPALVRNWFSEARAAADARRYELANALFDLIRDVLKAAGQGAALSAVADDVMPELMRLERVTRAIKAVPPSAVDAGPRPAETRTTTVTKRQDIYTQSDSGVIPPVPVQQTLPEASVVGRAITTPLEGELELVIGPTGTVQSAHLSRPIHPTYDPVLLKAAQQWTYRPATRNGKPVTYRAVMTLQLSSPIAVN